LARRKHAPCCTKIRTVWGLDCIYLHLPEEENYARRLSALLRQATLGPTGDVALNLVCFDGPLLPPRWPQLSRPTWDPIREFSTTGHLRAPGDDVARDSAYALFHPRHGITCQKSKIPKFGNWTRKYFPRALSRIPDPKFWDLGLIPTQKLLLGKKLKPPKLMLKIIRVLTLKQRSFAVSP
jgi:hypothetical protein